MVSFTLFLTTLTTFSSPTSLSQRNQIAKKTLKPAPKTNALALPHSDHHHEPLDSKPEPSNNPTENAPTVLVYPAVPGQLSSTIFVTGINPEDLALYASAIFTAAVAPPVEMACSKTVSPRCMAKSSVTAGSSSVDHCADDWKRKFDEEVVTRRIRDVGKRRL